MSTVPTTIPARGSRVTNSAGRSWTPRASPGDLSEHGRTVLGWLAEAGPSVCEGLVELIYQAKGGDVRQIAHGIDGMTSALNRLERIANQLPEPYTNTWAGVVNDMQARLDAALDEHDRILDGWRKTRHG